MPCPAMVPPENSPSIYCTTAWVGTRASLRRCGKKKISFPHQGSNPKPSNLQQITILTMLTQVAHSRVCYDEVILGIKQFLHKENEYKTFRWV